VIIMEPLRGGNLANTPPAAIKALWDTAPTRHTPAEWALRWVWNHPEATVVLSGMSNEAQLQENLDNASNAMPNAFTQSELDLVERVSRVYRELMAVNCTGCGYCMPCPQDVLIPMCFEEYNKMRLFGGVEEAKFRYALRLSGELISGPPGFASRCVQCGECVDKCPQNLPIPELLAKVAADLEDDKLMQRVAVAKQIFKKEAPTRG
jgi:uncharacterized protein